LVKVAKRYQAKPYIEVKALAVTCCHNRINDLAVMNYSTHRRIESIMLSLDGNNKVSQSMASTQADADDNEIDVGKFEEYCDMDGLMQNLSIDGQRLVKEVLNPSERAQQLVELALIRRKAVNSGDGWIFAIQPGLLQRALGWTEKRLNSAWAEVIQAVAQW